PELTAGREVSDYNGSHFPLFHNLIYMNVTDPGNVEYEIVPLREGFMHLNILKFLEVSPCSDCFEIVGFDYPEPGYIDVDFKITHPYDDPLYTIFDVRGIMMFDGSHTFPLSGMTISDSIFGDGEFLNPDGYTSLYNTWLIGPAPPIQEYFQGVYASEHLPDALVNGYIRHISDDPSNTRNALLTGDSVTRTYSLKYPANEFVFGYAVDASWAVPIETPVDDPMTDFGLNANSSEPWKIVVTPFMEEMTDEGGTTWLQIDVYDRGGKDTHDVPLVECSELFDGEKIAGFKSETDDFSRYHVALTNQNLAPGGFYKCLISVQDNDYNPNFPWIDMKAYQVVDVRVEGHPVAVAGADPNPQTINEPVYFWSFDSYDPDGGMIVLTEWDWDNDGLYDENGPEIVHSFTTGGYHQVQCRVTDDEGQTDILDEPLQVLIAAPGVPVSPVDITPEWMNFTPYGVYMEGNLAYITAWPSSLNIYDLTDPYNPVRLGRVDLPGISSKLVISDGYAYVAYDTPGPEKLLIIDVDPPGNSYIAGELDMEKRIRMVQVKDGYVYIGQYAYLKIINANPPESPAVVNQVQMTSYQFFTYTPMGLGYWSTGYADAISAAILGDHIYVADSMDVLHVIDISIPESGTTIKELDMNTERVGSYGNNLVNFGEVPDTLEIYNANPSFLTLLNSVSLPNSSYNGLWVDPVGVAGIYNYTQCFLVDIDPINEMYITSELNYNARRIHGANGLACMVDSDVVRVLDTDPPESAFITSEFEYPGEISAIEQVGEYAYIVTSSGIEIYDIEPQSTTHKVGEILIDGGIGDLEYSGNHIFATVSNDSGQLLIIDVQSPENPSIIQTFNLPEIPRDICVQGEYAYVGTWSSLIILDIDPIASLFIVNTVPVPGGAGDIDIKGGIAYATSKSFVPSVIHVLNVDPPESAYYIKYFHLNSDFWGCSWLDIQGNYIFIASTTVFVGLIPDLNIFDISSPEDPVLIKTVALPSEATKVLASGNYAYVTTYDSVVAVDITTPENALITSISPAECKSNDAAIDGEFLYVPTDCGLQIFELW
ncbi:hypothetical protein KAU08_03665, partial [bacterium]|nr:hypothetical protein [bacterium]